MQVPIEPKLSDTEPVRNDMEPGCNDTEPVRNDMEAVRSAPSGGFQLQKKILASK